MLGIKQRAEGTWLPASARCRWWAGRPGRDRVRALARAGKAVQRAAEVDDQRSGLATTTGGDGRVVARTGCKRKPDRPERSETAMKVLRVDLVEGPGKQGR